MHIFSRSAGWWFPLWLPLSAPVDQVTHPTELSRLSVCLQHNFSDVELKFKVKNKWMWLLSCVTVICICGVHTVLQVLASQRKMNDHVWVWILPIVWSQFEGKSVCVFCTAPYVLLCVLRCRSNKAGSMCIYVCVHMCVTAGYYGLPQMRLYCCSCMSRQRKQDSFILKVIR